MYPGRGHLLLRVASPNDIHNSENFFNCFCSEIVTLNAAPLYVSCKNQHPLSKFLPIALQRISSRGNFPFLFWPIFTISLDFKLYAILTMKNRFLWVQILVTWVVFAVKAVTLLWQPTKSSGHYKRVSLQYSNLLQKLNYFIPNIITKGL